MHWNCVSCCRVLAVQLRGHGLIEVKERAPCVSSSKKPENDE